MNPTELEIYNEILERVCKTKRMNNSWLELIWWSKKSSEFSKLERSGLYKKEYNVLDYLDARRNLIEIPNFCKHTGKKVNKNIIKENLLRISS